MSETTSFITLTQRAFHIIWQKNSLWWFVLPVGIVLWIGSDAAESISTSFPEAPTPEAWLTLFTAGNNVTLFGLLFLMTFLQSALRGILVVFANRQIQNHPVPSLFHDQLALAWRAGRVSLTFDLVYWLVMLGIGLCIAVPCVLAWQFAPTTLQSLINLGSILLIMLGIYLYFVKELSCLYGLLGKVRFSSAIDLGFRLFRKHSLSVLLFFSYTTLLALFFSLSFDGIRSAFASLFPSTITALSLLFFLSLGLYFIFDQILRLLFFHTLAIPPAEPAAEANASLPTNENSSPNPVG